MEHGDLYRQIVRSFTDGVVVLELDGTIRLANESAEELLGARGIAGQRIDRFLDETGRRDSAAHLARAAEGAFVDAEVDTMLVRADGAPLWVRLRQTGLREGEQVTAVILRLTDNHLAKQMQEEVGASRESLMRAERIARSGSWTWDVTAGTTTYSEGLVELYGGHTVDLMARDRERLLALTHPEDHQRLFHALDLMLTGAEPSIDVELRQRGRHGWMWVRLRALGSYGPDGVILEASGTYQDITRARATEDQLQDLVTQNSLMQAVASAANEATSLDEVLVQARSLVVLHDDWDRARAFVPSGDGSTLVPHLAEEDDVDDELADIAAVEQATAEACFRSGRSVWDDGPRLTIAFAVRLEDEVLAVLTLTSRPPLYRHDMIQEMVEQAALQLTRVAERERAGEEVAAARDRAVRASEHKSDFLATMSHEIRTPLNGIIGLNELLGATPLSDRQQHLVSGIAVSSRSLLELINDILDFSKIEAGHLDVESVDFEVREVLADVGHVLAESARARDIDLQVSCSPDVPDVLSGDPVRLKQVLLNLGSNAVKFTTEGSVAIRAMGVPDPDAPGESMLRVEVRDTGMGITETQQRHIFSPFTQADTSTTRRFGGTGLGLAICAELVAAFGGEIGVESQPGAGSTFWFTARLGAATGSTQDATLARAREALGDTRILVVDDNPRNRMILCEQLGWWHVSSRGTADSGQALSALAAAAEQGRPFDAVLLDLAMPGHDGLALAAAVRRAGYPADLPLILLTSAYTPTDEALRAAGITACLTKPVPSSALRDTLLATLTTAGPGPGAGTGSETTRGAGSRRGLVLVVEDNIVNQMVARGFLESLGHTVETAGDGEVALAMIEDGVYDAVLMDVQMPRLDGYATTRVLRQRRALGSDGRRLPIIAMTAAAIAGEREKCLAAGMDDFVTKPVSPTTLASTLTRWMPDVVEAQGTAEDDRDRPDGHDGPASEHLDLERLGMLLELSSDDTAYLDRAIGHFLEQHATSAAAVRRAVEAADAAALSATAHAVRGSAGNLGLPVVTALATDLEALGRTDAVADAGRLVDELDVAMIEATEALLAYREWYQAR